VLKRGAQMTAAQVLELFRGRIARYKHPREVRFLDQLPRSALGKVQKENIRLAVSA